MKEAKSVKCYDSKTNCAEVLGWKGGCHQHGEDCKKVRPCLHSHRYFCDTMYVQSCGLCDGDTPHESNTDCYDTVDDGCEEVAKNSCYRNKEVCKKVRLHNDKRRYMRG